VSKSIATYPNGWRAISLDAFQVPPRFDRATFASYQPDPAFPSQQMAVDRLSLAVGALNDAGGRRGLLARFRRPGGGTEPGWQALYLDGRFGVGKTHLLAAAYHAASVARAYLTFQELTYAVGALGMAETLDLFAAARLICLDEFELDDPGNTMLATSFVRGILDRGARLIVTSNTLPGELGRGRFSADEFEREIGELAAAFESIRIDGDDYRHRHFGAADDLPRMLPAEAVTERWPVTRWPDLLAHLAATPPLAFVDLLDGVDVLAIVGMDAIADQDAALRFVHFIDKVYDRAVPLVVASECRLSALFPSSYGYGGFERKFRRCGSRLHEMLSQPLDAGRGVDMPGDVFETVEEERHARRP
jgi:cell division protein ZapE